MASTPTLTIRVPLLVSERMLTKFSYVVAVAGQDFCIVAADTRISQGFNILSREHSKTTRLTDQCVITSGGMVADIETLHKLLIAKVKTYERTFKRPPTVEALA